MYNTNNANPTNRRHTFSQGANLHCFKAPRSVLICHGLYLVKRSLLCPRAWKTLSEAITRARVQTQRTAQIEVSPLPGTKNGAMYIAYSEADKPKYYVCFLIITNKEYVLRMKIRKHNTVNMRSIHDLPL